MGTNTNFAREGASAVKSWNPAPAWSAISPIPNASQQVDQLIATNPIRTIEREDIVIVGLGTNDGLNVQGGTASTATEVRDAILNAINRLIAHGFTKVFVVYPESRLQPTLPGLLEPQLQALVDGNRRLRISSAYWDSAILEFDNPYINDGQNVHPVHSVHKRMGELLSSIWFSNDFLDHTKNFYISSKLSSPTNVREIGFNQFNPNTDMVRMRLVDAFNCFEAHTNRSLTFRSYNGLFIKGASEANAITSPTGGGKNDPCVTIAGEFWEHRAILQLDAVGGTPNNLSPFLLARKGGTDKIRIGNEGSITVDSNDANAGRFISRNNDIYGVGVGVCRVIAEHNPPDPASSNTGIGLNNNGTEKWALASFRPAGTNDFSFGFYNSQPNPAQGSLAFMITPNSRVGYGTATTNHARFTILNTEAIPFLRFYDNTITPANGNSGLRAEIQNDGSFNTVLGYRVGGTRVIGAQITGYGTMANANRSLGLSSASTAAQVSAVLAALITDLRTHGLIL
ncbi:MAG: hypothetical protein ACRDBG_21745, partial [Waterburya sp.]